MSPINAYTAKIHEDHRTVLVRYHYDIWAEEDENGISLLDKLLHKLIEVERKENGREEKTTMIIVDSRSVQNTDTAEIKGYDAGKKNQV